MPILKIDWHITKAYIHGTPWHFHTLYKKRWSEETNGYIRYIKHLLYLSVGSIQFSILSRTQDLDFLVTTALLSWIIQVFAEGTASLKTLDQEYTRTFKEQRKVCQKATWVEQNGGKKKAVAGQVCLFSHLQSDFILCGGNAMGGLWSDLHHQVIYGKFLQVSNLTNCSLMQPTSDKHWLEKRQGKIFSTFYMHSCSRAAVGTCVLVDCHEQFMVTDNLSRPASHKCHLCRPNTQEDDSFK